MTAGGPERREWLKVSHTPSGTLVSVTLQEGPASVKWAIKAATIPKGSLKRAVLEARAAAETALAELQEATVSD